MPNFIAISLRGAFPQSEILRFCDLSCPVLSRLYFFFSQLRPGRTPGRILTVYSSNAAQGCAFKGLKPPKNFKKGAWLGI